MSWFSRLFGRKAERISFSSVDWQTIDGRWRSILSLSQQDGQANAKQSLLQADMLLDSVMKSAGVAGSSFAERLRRLQGKFSSGAYNSLWRAHKKRNELVHESGSHIESWERQEYLKGYQRALDEMRGWR